ncbi:MAG: M23 family metallopeptidase [Clostridia bacterium]|nr:M23 family metallopeptidase [Clostridia bacterium]
MKSFDKNKLKKQLVSGGIYIALAAAVVTVTMNGVNSIIGSSDDYELPQEQLRLPDVENSVIDGSDFILEIRESTEEGDDIVKDTAFPSAGNTVASGTGTQISSEISELPDSSENNPVSNPSQNIPADNPATVVNPTQSSASETTNGAEVSAEPEGIEYPTEPEPDSYGFYAKPAEGYIDKEYSDDKLIYSTTMGDYRTHNGIDITGDLGSPVKAINSGVIEDIYYDDFYGYTVKINHGDEVIAYYMNLSEAIPSGIEIGKSVKIGQTIGGIGNSAAIESAEVSHLHLSITKNGVYTDPREFLNGD